MNIATKTSSKNQVSETVEKACVSGSEDIGKLYDVFGEMASTESCNNNKGQVVTGLDVMAAESKMVGSKSYYYPAMCELNTEQNLSDEQRYYGKTYRSFEESYSVQAGLSGSYGYFSATLDTKYSETTRSEEQNQYLTLSVFAQYGLLTLKNQDNLPLREDFSQDLNNPSVNAETLFKEWGTHLVVGVKIGGQSSYMCYSSKTTFQSEAEFSIAAEANYSYITGYAGYNQTSTEYNENVQGSKNLYVIGGDVSLPNQGKWDEWIASVQDNPDWMAFTSTGLKPVWELCSDTNRSEYLKDEFHRLYTPICSGEQNREVYGRDDTPQVGYVTKNPDWFVTGFGGRINSSRHFTRCAVQFESASTGVRQWEVDGDVSTFNAANYELIGEVPAGCALTGIGLREKDHRLNNMVFYYQVVNRGKSNNGGSALDFEINEMYLGDKLDGYEVEYKPSTYNTKALQGIEVTSSNKHGKVEVLNLYTAYFSLPIESQN